MFRTLVILCVIALLSGGGVAYYLFTASPAPRIIDAEEGDAVRGTYVARLSGCIACHTDSKGGRGLLAGGPAIETPFGTFYGPNITPDPEDGIGSWSLQDFAAALTAGKAPDGSPYYPVFPYTSYTLLDDQEIADLWAALQTVKPVSGKTPANEVDAPFDHRFLLIPWQTLFLKPGPYKPDPERSEAWNRGAFIVNGPGHCVVCHTPRDIFGALDESRSLEGGRNGPGGERVPAITAAALKEEGWSEADIAYALKTGLAPDGDTFGGSMGEVVSGSTKFLDESDRKAIAVYLLSE